jgi:hypothetical protein
LDVSGLKSLLDSIDDTVPEMRASLLAARKKKFWASKILVTGPNDIMVAHKFCDIFFYEKKKSDINI